MALVERYVDPDVSGGTGDGTSWANAYSSLNSWESAEQTDLVADGDSHIVYCRASSGTADTTAVVVFGWATDSTHFIIIQPASADKASTQWDTSKYSLEVAGTSKTIYVYQDYTVLDYLQFKNGGTTNYNVELREYSDGCVVKNCVCDGGSSGIVHNFGTDDGDFQIYNNIVINTQAQAIIAINDKGNSTVYNNTLYNIVNSGSASQDGIQADSDNGTLTLKNNIIAKYNGAGYSISARTNVTADYNICDNTIEFSGGTDGGHNLENRTETDSSSPGTGDWVVFADLTTGSEDFALQNIAENDAIGNGIGPGSDSNVPTVDIDGDARSGSTCDIGADEYVSGVLPINLSDTITMSDTIILNLGLNKSDSVSLSDSILKNIGLSNIDSISMSDSVSKSIGLNKSDTISISDNFNAIITLVLALNDSISMSDSISKKPELNKIDAINISDEIIKSFGLAISDTINLSDIISKSILINKSDTINLSDNFSALVALILNLSDTINLSDDLSKDIYLARSDTIILSDDISKLFGLTKSDIINLADQFSTSADVIYALLNFIAKNKTFNFIAKNKTFNFNAKSRGS